MPEAKRRRVDNGAAASAPVVGKSIREEYRERILSIYRERNLNDKIAALDRLLDKNYPGYHDLYDGICDKYNIIDKLPEYFGAYAESTTNVPPHLYRAWENCRVGEHLHFGEPTRTKFAGQVTLGGAVRMRDVDAVKAYFRLDVPKDELVYYLESSDVLLKQGTESDYFHFCHNGVMGTAISMCVHPMVRHESESENEKSYEILKVLIENGVSTWYTEEDTPAARGSTVQESMIIHKANRAARLIHNRPWFDMFCAPGYPEPGTTAVLTLLLQADTNNDIFRQQGHSFFDSGIANRFGSLFGHLAALKNPVLLMMFLHKFFPMFKGSLKSQVEHSMQGFATGMAKAALSILKYVNTAEHYQLVDKECSICYDNYESTRLVAKLSDCPHHFCAACLLECAQAGHNQCALCRVPYMDVEEVDDADVTDDEVDVGDPGDDLDNIENVVLEDDMDQDDALFQQIDQEHEDDLAQQMDQEHEDVVDFGDHDHVFDSEEEFDDDEEIIQPMNDEFWDVGEEGNHPEEPIEIFDDDEEEEEVEEDGGPLYNEYYQQGEQDDEAEDEPGPEEIFHDADENIDDDGGDTTIDPDAWDQFIDPHDEIIAELEAGEPDEIIVEHEQDVTDFEQDFVDDHEPEQDFVDDHEQSFHDDDVHSVDGDFDPVSDDFAHSPIVPFEEQHEWGDDGW